MFECLTKINWKKVGLFASGTLFGTAGIKALASDDAKKLYTNCTAAVLRAKETVMNTVTTVQENAEDIYEGAKQINEERQQNLQKKQKRKKKQKKKQQKKLGQKQQRKLQNSFNNLDEELDKETAEQKRSLFLTVDVINRQTDK